MHCCKCVLCCKFVVIIYKTFCICLFICLPPCLGGCWVILTFSGLMFSLGGFSAGACSQPLFLLLTYLSPGRGTDLPGWWVASNGLSFSTAWSSSTESSKTLKSCSCFINIPQARNLGKWVSSAAIMRSQESFFFLPPASLRYN